MNYGLLDFLNLVGSLGLFLFGMKLLSESLQKVAGDKMRSILASMTSNRFMGILTGFLVTTVVQSSSATTVMVVSFVNAGLLSLAQSIGVIMGANIGTTVTAWLISLLGFKFSIMLVAVPLIGLGFPMLFSSKHNVKFWGEAIIGFSLLFIGLDFLKGSVPRVDQNPEMFAFLSNYSNMGFGSILIFLGVGTLLTVVIQSSSATMALTLVMCNQGWISYEVAAAMVLGENIGTTITANIAALIGNVSAKRAARAHFFFNIIGVIWMLILFYPFTRTIANVLTNITGLSPYTNPNEIPFALSIFHSSFNIINTFVLVWFTPILIKIVTWLTPSKKDEDEEFRLVHINVGLMTTAELSLVQAHKEVATYAKRVHRMFGFVRQLFSETNDKEFDALYQRIEKYEGISDRIEVEIATYLNKVSTYELSDESSRKLQALFRAISEIESVSDSNFHLARTLKRKREQKVWFNQEIRDNLNKMFDLLDDAYSIMKQNLETSQRNASINLGPVYEIEKQINEYRALLKENHIKNIEANKYKYQAGVIYSDMFNEAEKMGDYMVNVSEAIAEIEKHSIN
ncbi:Na/Pi cotransporter family protein [Tenuifilum thalassicum]|uniref:Na/Pi cotransporter family protein n=1 Tax=Tenuifilum thalassicum TaxID=2590900 RepID=A0A7D3XNS9_9BACT|nr:Na/Pi cotransporter family protein [Tenuifilum thalassicum]QKG81156.1 Na/Pi cotransporter family protein [Tenuifilum thalassicum]